MTSSSKIKLNIPSILIGFIGLVVSAYALLIHIQSLLKPGASSLCDVNLTVNCTSVVTSQYGEIASIPLGSYGMAYFVIVLALAFSPKYAALRKNHLNILEFIVGVVGTLTAITLMYISYFVLKLMCPTCTVIHALVIIYTVLKLIAVTKNKEADPANLNPDSLIRIFAVTVCLSIPPLAAGLLTPILVDYFAKNQTPPVQTPTPLSSEAPDTNLQALLKINTSNEGDGEDFRKGNDDSKVIVQMFSDFGCPHCKVANENILAAQEAFGTDKLLFVYRFFPLSNKCNPYAGGEGWIYSCALAVATRCAGNQGKFWEFKDWAFTGQNMNAEELKHNFEPAGLEEKALKLGLDKNQFSKCLNSPSTVTKIKSDSEIAEKFHIKGTPLILINGQEYRGPHDPSSFLQAFQAASHN